MECGGHVGCQQNEQYVTCSHSLYRLTVLTFQVHVDPLTLTFWYVANHPDALVVKLPNQHC